MKMDVEAVVRRVREEVAGHRAEAAGVFDPGGTGAGRLPMWSAALPPLPLKAEYSTGELLVYSDRAFVESAYLAVLRRPADQEGLACNLQKLRSGEASKIEVLAQLRWSPEGRARGIHVDGLLAPFKLHQWRRKRFVGPLIKWAHAIFRLPALAERISLAEAVQARETQEMGQLINRMSAQIDARVGLGDATLAALADRLDLVEEERRRQSQRLDVIKSVHEALAEVVLRQGERLAELHAANEASIREQREKQAELHNANEALIREQREKLAALQAANEAICEQRKVLAAELDLQKEHLLAHDAALAQMNRVEELRAAELALQKEQLFAHGAALAEIDRAGELVKEGERALDPFYVAFEERFRGSRDLIRERALPYLDIVREAGAGTHEAPVLDLGCGRGDWLDILREQSLIARGVDSNRVFLDICRGRGLEVIEGDVLEILRGFDDASVGAITGMHIAEHLPFEVLVGLLDEAKRVLRLGGVLALETPNPENLWVASHWFYMDPTHRNPLPPEALKWIVEARGFAEVRIERWTVGREWAPPPMLDAETTGAGSINVLLGQLHAAPDYAIIARRIQ